MSHWYRALKVLALCLITTFPALLTIGLLSLIWEVDIPHMKKLVATSWMAAGIGCGIMMLLSNMEGVRLHRPD